jgi:trehalose 2-sulfotransferase
MPLHSYLVCATQRSGSTLLCELLKDTGVAGRPEEYFEATSDTGLPPHPGDYLEDLPRTGVGIRDDDTPPRAPEHSSLIGVASYREHLERTFKIGTTSNGVFGAKLMWRNLPDLQRLAGELPEYAGLDLDELLERLFDRPSYVWMTRRDKVRQAVSLWRALQTRAWRLEHAGDGKQPEELHYRFEGIDHLVRTLETNDEGWEDFFARSGTPVLRVVYEDDLEPDAMGAVRAVLKHIGVPVPATWRPREVLARQADALSDEWVAAYHRDAAGRSGRARSAWLSAR